MSPQGREGHQPFPRGRTEQFVGIVEHSADATRGEDVAHTLEAVKTTAVWDSGSMAHVVPRACLEQLGCANIIGTGKIMRGAGGHRVRHYGHWWITALFGAAKLCVKMEAAEVKTVIMSMERSSSLSSLTDIERWRNEDA